MRASAPVAFWRSGTPTQHRAHFVGLLLLFALLTSGAAGQTKKSAASQRPVAMRPQLALQSGQQYPSRLVFSPDRRTIIGTDGPRIHLWDLPSRAIRRTLESPLGWVDAVALSADGRTLAYAHASKVRFWDVSTGEDGAALSVPDTEITALAFSPDGRRLCTGSYAGSVSEWSVRTYGRLQEYAGQRGATRSLAYSPDGKRLAIGSTQGQSRGPGIQVWSVGKGVLLWEALRGTNLEDLSYAPDGKWLAVATSQTLIFEGETGKPVAGPPNHGYSPTVAFDPSGERLARGVENRVEVRSTRTWGMVGEAQETSPYTVRWSSDGKQFASVGLRAVIRLNTLDSAVPAIVLGERPPDGPIIASPDGRLLSFAAGSKLQVLDCLRGSLLPDLLNTPTALPEGYLPGSHTLIGMVRQHTADPRDDFLRLWDLDRAGAVIGELPPPAPRGTYGSTRWFAASSDGRLIATGADSGPFLLWDSRTLKQLRAISGPARGNAYRPVFVGNRYLAAVHPDASGFSLWDVETGEKLWSRTGFRKNLFHLTASPDGKLLAVRITSRNPRLRRHTVTVHLYKMPEGTLAGALLPPSRSLTTLEFTHDGSLLATGDTSGRIQCWDVAKRRRVAELTGHVGSVRNLAFTAAGDLMSTGEDSTARLWDLHTGKWRITWVFDLAPPSMSQLTGWLAMTPDGYYTAHGTADRLIRWRQGNRLFPASQFEAEFRKPDRISAILSRSLR